MAVVHTGGGADISGTHECRHHVQGCQPHDGPEHEMDRHRHGIRVKQEVEEEYYLRQPGDRGARNLQPRGGRHNLHHRVRYEGGWVSQAVVASDGRFDAQGDQKKSWQLEKHSGSTDSVTVSQQVAQEGRGKTQSRRDLDSDFFIYLLR